MDGSHIPSYELGLAGDIDLGLGGGNPRRTAAQVGTVPDFLIEAPSEFAAARERVESFDRERLRGVMRLVGLADPGPPIRVLLASEDSELRVRNGRFTRIRTAYGEVAEWPKAAVC